MLIITKSVVVIQCQRTRLRKMYFLKKNLLSLYFIFIVSSNSNLGVRSFFLTLLILHLFSVFRMQRLLVFGGNHVNPHFLFSHYKDNRLIVAVYHCNLNINPQTVELFFQFYISHLRIYPTKDTQ